MEQICKKDINLFIMVIKEISNYDFSNYSIKSLRRRLERILEEYNNEMAHLIDQLKNDPSILPKIINKIAVNTTELFRDPQVWHNLKFNILPELQDKQEINIWHPGCATGEEVYSMLMLLNELHLLDKANIIGSDINIKALEVAEKGMYRYQLNGIYLENFDKVINTSPYNSEIKYDVDPSKYMEVNEEKDYIQMNTLLLEKALFLKHDLVSDDKISDEKFDLIICRNVLIYFNAQLQNKVLRFFYESLNPDGILVIGPHESLLGPITYKFEKRKGYYKKNGYRLF